MPTRMDRAGTEAAGPPLGGRLINGPVADLFKETNFLAQIAERFLRSMPKQPANPNANSPKVAGSGTLEE